LLFSLGVSITYWCQQNFFSGKWSGYW